VNNLILGEQATPAIWTISTLTNYTSSDYNGFRPNPSAPFSFAWNSPPFGTPADFSQLTRPPGSPSTLEARQFKTLADYSQATKQDTHSVLVDYDIFVNVPPLNAQDKTTVQKVYKHEDLDFRLRPGSAAVDKGTPVPTVTNGHTGSAPDLGALELNVPPPHYGPRLTQR
jgi:hypothetical protein